MIKHITSGWGIHVGGNYHTDPYIDATRPFAGSVRYHGTMLEVFDGSVWRMLPATIPQIELSNEVLQVVTWAQNKMQQEQRWRELAKTNRALSEALAQADHANEALAIVAALCEKTL